MAFGQQTKPAFTLKAPKVVQTARKGPALSLPKPTLRTGKSTGKGCCGHV